MEVSQLGKENQNSSQPMPKTWIVNQKSPFHSGKIGFLHTQSIVSPKDLVILEDIETKHLFAVKYEQIRNYP